MWSGVLPSPFWMFGSIPLAMIFWHNSMLSLLAAICSTVSPNSFFKFRFRCIVGAANSMLTTSSSSFETAIWRGLLPFWFWILKSHSLLLTASSRMCWWFFAHAICSSVSPSTFLIFGLHRPVEIRSVYSCAFPSIQAMCMGVLPFLSAILISHGSWAVPKNSSILLWSATLVLVRNLTTCIWPLWHATWMGVRPSFILQLTLHPFSKTRNSTMSRWPFSQAKCNGVLPASSVHSGSACLWFIKNCTSCRYPATQACKRSKSFCLCIRSAEINTYQVTVNLTRFDMTIPPLPTYTCCTK